MGHWCEWLFINISDISGGFLIFSLTRSMTQPWPECLCSLGIHLSKLLLEMQSYSKRWGLFKVIRSWKSKSREQKSGQWAGDPFTHNGSYMRGLASAKHSCSFHQALSLLTPWHCGHSNFPASGVGINNLTALSQSLNIRYFVIASKQALINSVIYSGICLYWLQ